MLAGVLSALFGVGGGLIFVPTLIFLGNSARVAVATSLAAMVPVILMGSWRQTRYGAVRWRDADRDRRGVGADRQAGRDRGRRRSPNDVLQARCSRSLLVVVAVQLALRALRAARD